MLEVKDYKQEDYAKGWETFNTALTNAKSVAAKKDATQTEVDKALSDLNNVIKGLKKYTELELSGNHIVAIGDTDVPGFTRSVNAQDGTITVAEDVVNENYVVIKEETKTALNKQVPNEDKGGIKGIGYTGWYINFDNETLSKVKVFKDGKYEGELEKNKNQHVIVYTEIADKKANEDNVSYWKARVGENATWRFVWLDESGEVIGVTEFKTTIKLAE